jgi:hypothetical protein
LTFTLDPELRQYATDSQWEKLVALEQHGSQRAAAAALKLNKNGISAAHKAVLLRAAQHGYAPDYDMRDPAPDGFLVARHSQYYDKDGKPAGRWVIKTQDAERAREIALEVIEGFTSSLPRAEPVAEPVGDLNADLLACYPVGDLHLGMLAWGKETGADYDLKIGENLLVKATDYLVKSAPPCGQSLVVFLGDFMHYDSMIPETPTGHNKLDSDSRPAKMIRTAVRCMRYLIAAALERHGKVHVIVESGNHDPFSTLFLMECLRNVYENEPRVSIDDSPSHYHYFRFGKNLIGVHHGHGTKMQNLPLTMAADRPADWGSTEHRVFWTGHIHHLKQQTTINAQGFTGCTVEAFEVLGPEDAWAHQKSYRSRRSQKSIILHREHGEFDRHTVNPGMMVDLQTELTQ